MSIFAGIEHKDGATGREPGPTQGDYVLEVKSVSEGVTKFTGDEFFEVAFKVVESAGEPSVMQDGTPLKPLPVGAENKIFITKDQYGYYITDIRNIVGAISTSLTGEHFDPKDVTEGDIRELVSTEQPAKGAKFRARLTVKPGKFRKKSGEPVLVMSFSGLLSH